MILRNLSSDAQWFLTWYFSLSLRGKAALVSILAADLSRSAFSLLKNSWVFFWGGGVAVTMSWAWVSSFHIETCIQSMNCMTSFFEDDLCIMTRPVPPNRCSSCVFSSLLMLSLLYKVLRSSFLLVQTLLYRVEPCCIIHKLDRNWESCGVQRLFHSLFQAVCLNWKLHCSLTLHWLQGCACLH